MRPLLLLALAVGASACRSPDTPVPSLTEEAPLAAAVSPCARYTLRLEHAEWREVEGERQALSFQCAFRSMDPDAFVRGLATVTELVAPEGTELRELGLEALGWEDGDYGTFHFYDLKLPHRSDRLKRLRVECRVLRVLSWKTYEFHCDMGDRNPDLLCPPFRVSLWGTADSLGINAESADDLQSIPSAERDLYDHLGLSWVSKHVEFVDAGGRRPEPRLGWLTDNRVWVSYGIPGGAPDGDPDLTIAYPVRGTLRLPERYVVEVVPFEFTDAPLSR